MAMAMHKLVLCLLVCLWQLPPGVSPTGGAMGTVVGLVDSTYATLATVCALESGTLLPTCWGDLPLGTPSTRPMWALTAGAYFICGLTYDSHFPLCWGSYTLVTTIPAAYTGTAYAAINAGAIHVCALRASSALSPGTIDCWGDNRFEQLLAPAGVPMLSVSAGDFFTCAITAASNEVLCWGSIVNRTMPSPPGNGQFRALFAGRLDICGIGLDGYTECWSGLNPSYSNPYPSSSFSSMALTYTFTCAIQQPAHQAKCWSLQETVPTPPPYAFSFLSASAFLSKTPNGSYIYHGYICGVREDISLGNLYCWGTSPNSFASSFSSFSASKGICRDQCPKGQYPILTVGQCPNPLHKVCLDCEGDCLSTSPPPPPPPKRSTSSPSSPSTPPPNSNITSNNESSPTSSSSLSSSSTNSKMVILVSIAVFSLVLVAILGAFLIVRYRRNSYILHVESPSPNIGGSSSKLIMFTSRQIRVATNNFETIIGKGGFGNVYKGVLPNNQIVAIKKPHKPEGGGEYDVEFDILSKLEHPSLVNLLGYCKKNNALVFPYMENGSLHHRMMDPIARKTISNTKLRLSIAVQVAKGLQYMHKSNVIHRDVKTSNILLDGTWNAYIADFGISRYSPVGDKTHCTTRIVGTPYYLDPDYHQTGELTTKSDVFSFGVVLLELASGLSPGGLAQKARSLHAKGNLFDLVDKNLLRRYKDCCLSLLEIAVWCVAEYRVGRPTMNKVVQELELLHSQLS